MKILYSVLLCLILVSMAALAETKASTGSRVLDPLDELPWGESCADSIDLPFEYLPFCTTASTGTAVNDYQVPCIGGPYNTAPDAVYCLRVPSTAGGMVTASLCGSGYDAAIHVWRNRHPDVVGSTLIGCSNNACGDDGCVTFFAAPDSFYYIIVDGGQSFLNSGPYTLNVHEGTDCAANLCEPLACPYPSFDFEPVNNDTCNEAIPYLLDGEYCGTFSEGDPQDIYTIILPPGECRLLWIDVLLVREPGISLGVFEPFDIALYRLNTCDPHYDATQLFPAASGTGVEGWKEFISYCLLPGTYQLHVVPLDVPILPDGTRLDQYSIELRSELCDCFTMSFQMGDDEQTNSSCAAQNPALVPGDTVSGAISTPGDVDWYRLDINGNFAQSVTIDVFGNDNPSLYTFGQGLNPKLFLFGDECQTMLSNDDDGGTGSDARIESFSLPPGSYSLAIEGNGSSGPYALATSCASCPCETCPFVNLDDELLNGACALDNPVLECGDKVCGDIVNANDVDYYTFLPPQDACTWFTIKVLANDTPDQCAFGFGLDAVVDVYSGDCGWLMYSEDFGGVGTDPVATFSQEYPESSYKIAVRGSANSTGRYILQIDCLPTECLEACPLGTQEGDLFEYEYCGFSFFGNGCEDEFFSAYSIQCGETYYGYSDANDIFTDKDWYQLTIPDSNNQVFVCLETSFDAALSVIAAGPAADFCWDRDLLNCSVAPQCSFTCDTFCLAPGDYFIEVKPLAPYPVSCGKYRLSVQCGDCQPLRPEPVEQLTIHYPDDEIVSDPELTNVVLRWEAVQGADEYLVYRSTDPDPQAIVTPLNLISVTTNTFYVDEARIEHNGLPDQTYYAVVVRNRSDAAPCGGIPE